MDYRQDVSVGFPKKQGDTTVCITSEHHLFSFANKYIKLRCLSSPDIIAAFPFNEKIFSIIDGAYLIGTSGSVPFSQNKTALEQIAKNDNDETLVIIAGVLAFVSKLLLENNITIPFLLAKSEFRKFYDW